METRNLFIKSDLPASPQSFIILIFTAFSLLLAGCGDSATDTDITNGNDGGGSEPSPNEIQMVGQSFSPSNLEVDVGTTVTWKNESDLTHTVTSGSNRDHDGTFDSGNVAPGGTFSYTFSQVGTFDYFCVPHPGMDGTVTVVDN